MQMNPSGKPQWMSELSLFCTGKSVGTGSGRRGGSGKRNGIVGGSPVGILFRSIRRYWGAGIGVGLHRVESKWGGESGLFASIGFWTLC